MSRKEIPNDIFFSEVLRILQTGKSVTIPMRGVSMHPLLREGRDTVRLVAIDGQELCTGDIALFRYRGQYLLHRMISRDGHRLHMHGDGLLGNGEYCNENDIIAKVTHVIHKSSSTPLPTDSFRWKLRSQTWLMIRRPILRFIYLHRRIANVLFNKNNVGESGQMP